MAQKVLQVLANLGLPAEKTGFFLIRNHHKSVRLYIMGLGKGKHKKQTRFFMFSRFYSVKRFSPLLSIPILEYFNHRCLHVELRIT